MTDSGSATSLEQSDGAIQVFSDLWLFSLGGGSTGTQPHSVAFPWLIRWFVLSGLMCRQLGRCDPVTSMTYMVLKLARHRDSPLPYMPDWESDPRHSDPKTDVIATKPWGMITDICASFQVGIPFCALCPLPRPPSPRSAHHLPLLPRTAQWARALATYLVRASADARATSRAPSSASLGPTRRPPRGGPSGHPRLRGT